MNTGAGEMAADYLYGATSSGRPATSKTTKPSRIAPMTMPSISQSSGGDFGLTRLRSSRCIAKSYADGKRPATKGDSARIGVVIRRRPHRPPGIPGDLQDHERDHEPDDRIGDRHACGNDRRTGDHADRDEAVDAGVVTVGHKRGAMQPAPGA